MARVLVLGGGVAPYLDPWHPFAAVARAVAAIGLDGGHRVEVVTDVAGRIAAGLDDVDVLVALAPDPDPAVVGRRVRERAWTTLDARLERPVGLLGLHVGLTTLLGWPRWAALMGSRPVPGASASGASAARGSGHAPLGPTVVRTLPHRLTDGAGGFGLEDEPYAGMEVIAASAVAVDHEVDRVVHPLIWTRREGGIRIVADALGHGPASFDAPAHVDIVGRAIDWLASATLEGIPSSRSLSPSPR
jgi:hypothetical protein